MNISLENILEYLSLFGTGNAVNPVVVWSIILYIIFVLGLLMLFLMPDKNLLPTLLTAGMLMAAVLAKLVTAGAIIPGFRPAQFGMLIVNTVLFLFPFLIAGMARTRKRKNPVPPLGIITGIIGGIYLFMYGIFVMRWFFG